MGNVEFGLAFETNMVQLIKIRHVSYSLIGEQRWEEIKTTR